MLTSASQEGIPVVGPSGSVTSFVGAIRYWFDAPGMLQEGHRKVILYPIILSLPLS